MKLEGMTFPEAVAALTGRPAPSGTRRHRPTPKPEPRPTPDPEADALALVESAAARLWTPEGTEAVAYLRGRGLRDETIRSARLGWTSRAAGIPWSPPGVVIPWYAGGRLVFVKGRVDDAWRAAIPEGRRPPKYLAPRGWTPPRTLYPSPEAVRQGMPLVITEGELDALLLGQALGERAAAVTLGSATGGRDRDGIDPDILGVLLSAGRWYIATDADDAGDRAADAWALYPRARRVRPPGPFKDWSEAGTDAPGTTGTALNLSRWWGDILAGCDAPPLFSWEELAGWRWGLAMGDPTPLPDIGRHWRRTP
jgi:hypothetical protein